MLLDKELLEEKEELLEQKEGKKEEGKKEGKKVWDRRSMMKMASTHASSRCNRTSRLACVLAIFFFFFFFFFGKNAKRKIFRIFRS